MQTSAALMLTVSQEILGSKGQSAFRRGSEFWRFVLAEL